MPTTPTDVDDLRRQMAFIRRELHEDVKGVVATANAVTDWRRYLTSYPLVSLAAAVAIGYLIVPRKKKPVEEISASSYEKIKAAVRSLTSKDHPKLEAAVVEPPKPGFVKGLLGAGLGMLTPLAARAAQGYAIQYLEQWMAKLQEEQMRVASPTAVRTDRGGPQTARGTKS